MARDDRFYAFIIPHTSPSQARIRRICVEKKWLKLFALAAAILFCVWLYGFYGLTLQAQHFRIEVENQRLRAENESQRQELKQLSNRVEAVEDTSRKLAEKSGVVHENANITRHRRTGDASGTGQFAGAGRKNESSRKRPARL